MKPIYLLLSIVFGVSLAFGLEVRDSFVAPAVDELGPQMECKRREYPFRPEDYYFSPWTGKRLP